MSPMQPYRILLIDDQEAIHEDYRKILGNQLRQRTAALSRAAAELFGDDPPHVHRLGGLRPVQCDAGSARL